MNDLMDVDASFDYMAQAEYFGFTDNPVAAPRVARALNFAAVDIERDPAAVLSSTLAVYDDEMTDADREAFDDTILYAEIRADQSFKRETQRCEWYYEYSKALTMCGWPTVNDPYKEFISREVSFTMDEAALQIIALVAGADKLKILPLVSSAFASLEKNEGAIKLMELKSKKNYAANLQVVPCIVSNGSVQMVACALQMESRDLITQVLFFKYKGEDIKLYNAATRRRLNRRAYNVVKALIQETTDQHRIEYFKKGLPKNAG